MLRGIRRVSSNWLGKAVLGAVVTLLIISFAIWGVGDMFRVTTRTPVATIGSTEITADQFRQTFNERLQQLGRQLGRPVSMQQARAIGFDQQLLAQLVAEAALDESIRALGLNVSNAEVARRITADPAFQGLTGEFDRTRFEQLIRQSGYSEARFINEQRKVLLRRQLATALSSGVASPATASEAFARFENEERTAEYVVLTDKNAGEIAAPAPDVLQKYFDERKITFRAPEYRKIVILPLTPEEIARAADVSDEDAKRFYEERKARFTTPERRNVQQMMFPNEEEARKVANDLKDGAWFERIATERGLTPADINLGTVPKTALVDPAIAEAAFGLTEGEISAPVTGRFGTVLLKVNKIEPMNVTPYEAVADEIKREIAADRARAEINKRRDKIEDELAGGAKLEEAAQKAGTPVRIIDAVDRSGRGPDGNPASGLPQGADVLSGAFSTDIGVESDPLQAGGGYIWFEVGGITPARDRTLDEVKDRVEARWREDQLGTRLKAKADEIIEKLKAGKTFAEATEGLDLKIETAKAIKRNGTKDLPQTVVSQIFRTPKDAAGTAEGKDGTERYVFKVTEITVPPYVADNAETRKISDAFKAAITDELLSQYIAKVESELGSTINRAALNQALTTTGGN